MNLLKLSRKIVNNTDIPVNKRRLALELALAEAVASTLPIPCEKISGSVESYFRNNHKLNVIECLDTVNEFHVIDIDQTCDLAYHVWEVRYMFVHDMNNPKLDRIASLALAGNEAHIPPIYREVLVEYPEAYFKSFELRL